MSEALIKKIVKGIGLSHGNKMEGMRLKWVRFERDTPNSMWQSKWIVPVIDDCSRYCLAIGVFDHITTANMIALLEQCIAMHGSPREILTDNGPEFGGRSRDSDFDKWCDGEGIIHIRSGIHKPTTLGKVSRLQYTILYELPYCYNDLEYFRWRYNCDRPHRSLNGLTPHKVFFGWIRHKKYLLEKKFIIQGI
ncbi:transposase family protein [Candidatus Woesearchaeota archaeon]|nr:transposase family protein [Candidatus Woesearchaeota archaeon]